MDLEHVCFGGGGMHGLMYLGALFALFNNSIQAYTEWQRKLKSVAGTSVGALIGCLALLWDPLRIMAFMKTAKVQAKASLFDQDWLGVAAAKAVNSGKELNALLRQGVQEAFGSADATFQDLYCRTGIAFIVTVTCSSSGQTRFWSYANMPHLPVWQAIRASVSIPYVFPEFEVAGIKYIDGGMTCNVPCHLFPPERTLIMYVQVRRPNGLTPLSLLDLYMNAAQLGSFRVQPLYAMNSIPCVPAEDSVSPFNFGATDAALDALFVQGVRSRHAVARRNKLLVFTIYLTLQLLAARGGRKRGGGPEAAAAAAPAGGLEAGLVPGR